MSTEERLLRLENSFNMLVQLARGHEERMDTHLSWINQLGEAQANSERKLEAVADGLIRLEDALNRLTEAQARSDAAIKALAEAQARSEAKIEALADSHGRLEEAQVRTEEALRRLAESRT